MRWKQQATYSQQNSVLHVKWKIPKIQCEVESRYTNGEKQGVAGCQMCGGAVRVYVNKFSKCKGHW